MADKPTKIDVKNVLSLIAAHYDKDDPKFKDKALEIAKELDGLKAYQLSEYILAAMGLVNTFSPGGGEIRDQYSAISTSEWVLHSAFRYALYRRTAIVSMTCDEIARQLPTLSSQVLEMIYDELRKAWDDHNRGVSLGDECDAEAWLGLLRKFGDEFERRGRPKNGA